MKHAHTESIRFRCTPALRRQIFTWCRTKRIPVSWFIREAIIFALFSQSLNPTSDERRPCKQHAVRVVEVLEGALAEIEAMAPKGSPIEAAAAKALGRPFVERKS